MLSAVASSIQDRTGRSLDEWLGLVAGSGIDPLDQNAVRRWLRDEHGVRQNTQWALADAAAQAAGWVRPSVEAYIDEQFRGARAALRPLFDVVRDAATSCGPDVTVEGRGTYVPFVRRRQFAAAAATASRLDLGLRLPSPPAGVRLQPAKAPGQSTHKIELRTIADVDDEVRGLLMTAYDQNG
jgi:predicted transport protein